jgi:hypothetical protein
VVTALFEFTRETSDWSGVVDAISTSGDFWFNNQNASTVNGHIMQIETTDNLVMFHSSGQAGHGAHTIKSVFTVQDSGNVNQSFFVDSLNWSNTVGGSNEATIKGYSGGAGGSLVWTISGAANISNLVTTASSGALGDPIDTIVWEAPSYVDGAFGSSLDNVSVTMVAP